MFFQICLGLADEIHKMQDDHKTQDDQRTSERVRLGEVGLELEGLCSVGRIYDISATGVRIEEAGMDPNVGNEMRVTFVLSLDEPGFEVLGKVVRRTETGGFALSFEAVEPRLRTMLILLAERAKYLPDLLRSDLSTSS